MRAIKAVTFDCYGTLIDWERGILDSLEPFWKRSPRRPSEEEILRAYAHLEKEAEKRWRPYREILKEVFRSLAKEFGFSFTSSEEETFVNSLPHWSPFPEVNEVLLALERLSLPWGIISNIDQDLIFETLKHFKVQPNWVITAQEARSYKPYPAIFELALKKIALPARSILHVGQSLFHDVGPAKSFGFRTCWVRRPDRDPFGATPPAQAQPDWVVKNLREILGLIHKEEDLPKG